jgi:hypothetical protein
MPRKTIWEKSGVDPDATITKFVMEDFAAALIDAEWAEERIVEALKKTRPKNLADALAEGSRWTEIFECYADDLLDADE